MAPEIIVLALEAVEADRDAPQTGVDEPLQTLLGEGQTVGDQAPRIAAAGDLAPGEFQILAQEDLAAGKNDQHGSGVDMRRDLLVEHAEEIVERHVLHAGVDAAIAAAMTAREVAPEGTLPKERIEPVLGDRGSVEIGKYIERQPLAEAQPTPGHG